MYPYFEGPVEVTGSVPYKGQVILITNIGFIVTMGPDRHILTDQPAAEKFVDDYWKSRVN